MSYIVRACLIFSFHLQVTFNMCPTVHEIRAWKFAYAEARKGKWMEMGRDRVRFERRIGELSRILTPILAQSHRLEIYLNRNVMHQHKAM